MNDVLRPTVDSVRRLAQALALEAHGAEDLAQEAWLDALRKGVRAPELARWLGGATRRLARSIRRSEARRKEREARVTAARAEDGAGSAAAQIEVARRIVAAVEALEEPQRTAIVLRFFEDLPPRALAARLGIPVNTARSRVRRGLATLRERLDRRSLLVLAPFSLPDAARRGTSPWARVGIAAGCAGAVLVGSRLFHSFPLPESEERAVGLARASSAGEERPAASGTAALATGETGRAPNPVQRAEVEAARAPTAAPAPVVEEAEIAGRLVQEDGQPAAGERLLLVESTIAMDPSAPPPGELLSASGAAVAVTDAEGRFHYRLRPAPRLGYALVLEGPIARSWAVPSLARGDAVDLGELVLARGASLVGRLVDGAGHALRAAGWKIHAQGESPTSDDTEVGATVPVAPESGVYRLEGLPEGRYELHAVHPLAGWIAGPRVELVNGGAEVADLVYDGPELARRIRLDVGHRDALPDAAHVRLRRPGHAALQPTRVERTSSFVFDDLPPGEYALEIDDPRFVPWSREGIAPGTLVRAELAGNAALRFQVWDRRTGEPVELFRVEARRLEPGMLRDRTTLHRGKAPLADGLLAGIVPGTYALTVSAEGRGRATLDALELAPGETRPLALALGPGEWAAGTVRRADGTPAAGCKLALFREAADRASAPRRPLAWLCADPEGAFRLQLPSAGSFRLETEPTASKAPSSTAPSALCFSIGEDESAEGLELVVP